MNKTEISVITVGHTPIELNLSKIKSWKSDIFNIKGDIENYALTKDSDIEDWAYSDCNLEEVIPENHGADFLIAIVNVPLELKWYSRRLNNNRVIFTFHEVKEILGYFNLPLENAVYRLLYAYTLFYKRSGSRIPLNNEPTNFTHDETRGCIFDMNGLKWDIIQSLHQPQICSECVERLRSQQVSNQTINTAQKEIKRIKKPLFFRIMDFIKLHPLWSLIISGFSAIILGALGSILGNGIIGLVQ